MKSKRGKYIYIRPEIRDEIIRLYTQLEWTAERIGAHFNISDRTIRNRLRLWGVQIHAQGRVKVKCIDCKRPTDGKHRRCKIHVRTRRAEMRREWERRVYNIPEARWKV